MVDVRHAVLFLMPCDIACVKENKESAAITRETGEDTCSILPGPELVMTHIMTKKGNMI